MSSEIVLVTGATSFIGSHVINLLLQDGWKVRGTVRDLTSKKTMAIQECFAEYKDQLELVVADLKDLGVWPAVVEGCTYVHHTAAPVTLTEFSDESNNYLRPPAEVKKVVNLVVDSTKALLEVAIAAGVKRFIMTSSVAAMVPAGWCEAMYPIPDVPGAFNPNVDISKPINEETWTDEKLVDGYLLAKTLQEKAAWETVKGSSMELVCVNPAYTTGPPLHKEIVSDSTAAVDMIMQQGPDLKKMSTYCGTVCLPSMKMLSGDVRDVAQVHAKAMTSPKAPGNRYLVTNRGVDTWEMMDILKETFQPMGYNTAYVKIPMWMVAFVTPCNPFAKRAYQNRGRSLTPDISKICRDFDIKPIDVKTSIIDTALAQVAVGRYERRPGFKTDKPEFQPVGKSHISLKASASNK